jgi:hypothetical protein
LRLHIFSVELPLACLPACLPDCLTASASVPCRVFLFFGGWPVIWLFVNVFVWCLLIQYERWYYK